MKTKRTLIISMFFLCFIMLLWTGCGKKETAFTDLSQLNQPGRVIATWAGYTTENMMKKYFPDANALITSDSIAVNIANLREHKVDAFMIAKVFYDALPDKAGLTTLGGDLDESYYAFFFAQNEKGKKLRNEMNEFIAESNENGLRSELEDIWLGENAPGRPVGTGSDDPDAPELIYAVENLSPPFGFVENDSCTGYDVDYADCFCKKYGYRLKVIGLPFPMIAAGDTNGEYDFAGGALLLEGDFRETKVVSESHFSSPFVLIIRDNETAAASIPLKDRLYRTFLEGSRWKMYLNGLFCTLLIFVVSALAGTFLGFLLYLICTYTGNWFYRIVHMIFTVLHITPSVVLLMIFYHIVFREVNLSGLAVSIIVFALLTSGSVFNLLTSSVNTIDHGQREAAIVLGCTPSQVLFRVILPQAMRHFIPAYKGELIGLIKITSIVGYIAVQDLTKTSDIIQTRTFDAFVPLFSSAVIYILLAVILICLVNLLFRKTDPKNRSREKILAKLNGGKEADK